MWAFSPPAAQNRSRFASIPTRDVAVKVERCGWRRTVPAYNRALLDVAAAQGVAAIDVRRWAHGRQPAPFADESHFTFAGHEAFGNHLARELVRLGVVDANDR